MQPLFSEEEIKTFTDDEPETEITPEAAEEATKEVKEENEDESDEITLFTDTTKYFRDTIFPENVIYSTEDIGDLVAIEHDVEPGEENSTDDLGDEATDDFGDDSELNTEEDAEVDISEEMRLFREWRNSKVRLQPGMEDWKSNLYKVVGFMKTALLKTAKYTRRVYMYARDEVAVAHLSMKTMQKLYERKIKKNLHKASDERLSEYSIESFDYSTWIDTAKLALDCFDFVTRADNVVFDLSDGEGAGVTSMRKRLELGNIILKPDSNKIDMDDLLDKRKYTSINELGFNKAHVGNCLRYLNEIAKRLPYEKENPLQDVIDITTKKLTNQAAMISQDINTGRLNPNSEEYKNTTTKLMYYTSRLDFVLTSTKVSLHLMKLLTKDLRRVLRKYEDAMTSKSLV